MGCQNSTAAQPQARNNVQHYQRGAPVLLGQGGPQAHHQAYNMHSHMQPRKAARPAIDDSSTVIWRSDAAPPARHPPPQPVAPPPSHAAGSCHGRALAQNMHVMPPMEGSWGSGQKDRIAGTSTTARSQEDAHSGSVSAASESTSTPSQVSSGSFPQAMTPLDLVQTGFRTSDFHFERTSHFSDGEIGMASWSACVDKLGFAAKTFCEKKLPPGEKAIRGHISKLHSIIMSEEEMENLGIVPEAASLFAFSYPVVTLQELQITHKDAKVPDIALLVFGGFMYFDSDLNLRDVRAVVPSDGSGMLRFRAPTAWKPEWTVALGEQRWKPVTLPALRKVGVRYFCWLLPGETLPGHDGPLTDNGGFVYIFHEPGESGVLQAKFDALFGIAGKPEEEANLSQGKFCPKCHSRRLQWSDYDKGPYAGGWDCENGQACGMTAANGGKFRWFCPECSFDICNRCHSTMWVGNKDC